MFKKKHNKLTPEETQELNKLVDETFDELWEDYTKRRCPEFGKAIEELSETDSLNKDKIQIYGMNMFQAGMYLMLQLLGEDKK